MVKKKWPGKRKDFHRDLTAGKMAERYIAQVYLDKYFPTCDYLTFNKTKVYDISFAFPRKDSVHVEVKFDKYGVKSGNLCFELQDHKGNDSGIMATEAHLMVFVVTESLREHKASTYDAPGIESWNQILAPKRVQVFEFDVPALRAFIESHLDSGAYKIVKGGDGNAFEMMLIPIIEIVKEPFCKKVGV